MPVFSWEWSMAASPEHLWPWVSDTDRFNRDTGLPGLLPRDPGEAERILSFRKFGLALRWREDPFEWSRPRGFSVRRRYLNGPLEEMRVKVGLDPVPGGGTRLRYRTDLSLRWGFLSPILSLIFRFAVKPRFDAVFRAYDRNAKADAAHPGLAQGLPEARIPASMRPERTFAHAGKARLAARFQDLLATGADPLLAARLRLLLEDSDDADLARIRPYAVADRWGAGRRETLELCLFAARTGLLDFRWDLLCPSCRGAKFTAAGLKEIKGPIHCDSCNIDFSASFDRSVEVTFAPNRSIRAPRIAEYCAGSPQRTPHIHFRKTLEPGEAVTADLVLDPGMYRLRSPSLAGAWHIRAGGNGATEVRTRPEPGGWPRAESAWHTRPTLTLSNPTGRRMAFILERNAWADDAATASEVTALQRFRDLFADEALRPGEEISVGSLAFLFTDLRGSTRLYREAGDAKAFGLVMEHFDVLKSVIASEGGGVVKTIGDAVMAVFPRPQAAVRAALESQRRLMEIQPLLVLKAGVHCGPCIAVNQNDRLDYFGSTLNLAARLLGFSGGGDLVVSSEVGRDPETAAWLSGNAAGCVIERFDTAIRGFERETFALMRLTPEKNKISALQKN